MYVALHVYQRPSIWPQVFAHFIFSIFKHAYRLSTNNILPTDIYDPMHMVPHLVIEFIFGIERLHGFQVVLEDGDVRLHEGLTKGLHDLDELSLILYGIPVACTKGDVQRWPGDVKMNLQSYISTGSLSSLLQRRYGQAVW